LPAAAVVVAVTLVAAYALLGVLDRPDVMADGASAALSVANIRFALAAGDYFTTVTQPSPFLHCWSLGVEEQFYLVWPLLLAACLAGGGAGASIALFVVLVLLRGQPVAHPDGLNWAFYFLRGGLGSWPPAASWPWRPRPSTGCQRPLAVAGWVALAGLVVAAVVLTSDLAYPGLFAVAPTACAVILLASGPIAFGPGLCSTRPIAFWDGSLLAVPLALADPHPAGIALGAPLELGPRIALALSPP
jgi:peptidoglycan/LPS O-acetylase OafA/YrhL